MLQLTHRLSRERCPSTHLWPRSGPRPANKASSCCLLLGSVAWLAAPGLAPGLALRPLVVSPVCLTLGPGFLRSLLGFCASSFLVLWEDHDRSLILVVLKELLDPRSQEEIDLDSGSVLVKDALLPCRVSPSGSPHPVPVCPRSGLLASATSFVLQIFLGKFPKACGS